ncbi:MAG TPA: penicillin-binding protein 2 [Acidimicrobiia bacterium]|nr:penicillin-binding protein 2 [Acidimicrobiia bacterium]
MRLRACLASNRGAGGRVETPARRVRRRRMVAAALVTVSCFLTLFSRLVHLQVAERPAYAARAEANRLRELPIEAPRGRILDRTGRVLADTGAAWRVRLDRRVPKDRRADLLQRLAPVLGVPVSQLQARVADPAADPVAPVTLIDGAPEDVVVALRERQADFDGVEVDSHPVRRYPHERLAAHVLGTLGAAPGPGRAGRRGGSGVEAAYDHVLAGQPGESRIEVDSVGRPVRTVGERLPVPGRDLHLTLDLDVQTAAERALAEAMALARSGSAGAVNPAPGGAVVALDLRDGSVLALASAPTFDPAALAGRIPARTWAALQDPAAHAPLTNRVLQGLYAPGSTFKPVTALAGLASGLITPQTVVDDRGKYRLGSRSLQNAQGRAYGKVDLARAMAVSSDVYFYGLGDRMARLPGGTTDDGPIQDFARRLGFGRPTGIDIGPEAGGRVPGPASRREASERRLSAVRDGRWYPGDNVNLAIGQGDLLVTPLQLASAYAALATGVIPPRPRVVGEPGGAARAGAAAAAPVQRATAGIDPGARHAVLTGLLRAVGTKEGTAAAAFAGFPVDRMPVLGKTGTAQVNGKADTALFAAVAPAHDPRYAVVAVVEESGFGSVIAAPIVRRVLEVLTGVGAPPERR